MLGEPRYTDEYQSFEVGGRKCKIWNETGAEARQRSEVCEGYEVTVCVMECVNCSYVLMVNPQGLVK